MKKLVYLPLDERPCNFNYVKFLLENNRDYNILQPDKCIMGDKKTPANHAEIENFLLESCGDAHALVISIDTLLYGGIVPSRLHHMDIETLSGRLKVLNTIKSKNPAIKIYAFSLIMRCPQYSSADEEPDYYGECGREIFLLGEALDKQERGFLKGEELNKIEVYEKKTAHCIDDFLGRRKMNLAINQKVIDMVGKAIEFLIIPQDDAAVYGFTAKDQKIVRAHIRERKQQLNIYMYPGADEVGMVLVSRAIMRDKNCMPTVNVKYSSTRGEMVIPLFEDRIVGETIKYQILAAGGIMVDSEDSADIILMVNTPSSKMLNASLTPSDSPEYCIGRNIVDFTNRIEYLVSIGKSVAIADIAYANGGDLEFVELLSKKNLLLKVAAYAGWNTSSNTIGTTIFQAYMNRLYTNTAEHYRFLALRFFEDIGYCVHTRRFIASKELEALGLNYFNVGEREGVVANLVKEEIIRFISDLASEITDKYTIKSCYMPWKRMFEVGLTVEEKQLRGCSCT